MSDTYGPPPVQDPTQEEKTWALAAHIGALVAIYVAMGFLAPLLVLLVKGDSSPFVRRHAVESLNFQISLLIYSVVGVVVGFLVVLVTFGLGMLVVLPVGLLLALAAVGLMVLATVRAGNGETYDYPLTIRFIR